MPIYQDTAAGPRSPAHCIWGKKGAAESWHPKILDTPSEPFLHSGRLGFPEVHRPGGKGVSLGVELGPPRGNSPTHSANPFLAR